MNKHDLPKYQCHKVVKAAKIVSISGAINPALGLSVTTLNFSEGSVDVDGYYLTKHKPEIGGYYVLYEDGYESFSPAEAFESGYSLLQVPVEPIDKEPIPTLDPRTIEEELFKTRKELEYVQDQFAAYQRENDRQAKYLALDAASKLVTHSAANLIEQADEVYQWLIKK